MGVNAGWTRGQRGLAGLCALGVVLAFLVHPLSLWLTPELANQARLLRLGVSPGESGWRYLAELVAWSRELGLALTAVSFWFLACPIARRPRAPRVRTELLRALPLAAVPGVVAGVAVVLVTHGVFPALGRALEAQGSLLLVPAPLALGVSLALGAYLLALAWRLTRPAPADGVA